MALKEGQADGDLQAFPVPEDDEERELLEWDDLDDEVDDNLVTEA